MSPAPRRFLKSTINKLTNSLQLQTAAQPRNPPHGPVRSRSSTRGVVDLRDAQRQPVHALRVALNVRRHDVVVQPPNLPSILRRLKLEVREEHRQRDLW